MHHNESLKERPMAVSSLPGRYRDYYRRSTSVQGRRRRRGEAGYVLAMTALLLVPMLVAVSFAIDAGAWEAQASRMQRAADAAALAGVVRLPDTNAAEIAAEAVAAQNGFSGASVDARPDPTSATRYIVSVTAPGQRFFSSTFQSGAYNLTRDATAEFNKPVPMGSPNKALGTDPSSCPNFQPAPTGCGPQTMLWSAIQGPFTAHQDGDPYTTKCSGNNTALNTCNVPANTNGAQNPDYKKTGYSFAIEVGLADVGSTLTVQLWDVAQIARSNNLQCPGVNGANCQTGDSEGGNGGPFDGRAPLQLEVFANDGTDFGVAYATSKCERYWPRTGSGSTADTALMNTWTTACTFTADQGPGIYPMRIKTSNITTGGTAITDHGSGWNAFSIRVTGGTTATRLYALDDLSIWTNLPSSNAQFYLAEIKTEHQGKRLLLDLYDPGDGSAGTYTMSVKAPPSNAPNIVPTGGTTIPAAGIVDTCRFNNTGTTTRLGLNSATMTSTGAGCSVVTRNSSGNRYNERWLRVEIKLAANYSCSADCWWSIQYNFGSAGRPTDRTVWSLQVVGDPVHLVD
jgi:hypothetical protein